MSIQAVLFDLDGTLLDSARDFIVILQTMRIEHGLPPLDETTIRQKVSAGAAAMVSVALDIEQNHPDFDALKENFLQRYSENYCTYSCLFSGLSELLVLLEKHQIPWGIATNKPQHFTRPILEKLQLDNRASVQLCPEQVNQPKPAPDMLLLASQQLNIPPQHILYIGDDSRDIQAATAANMPSMAVGYGYHSPQDNPESWGANHYVKDSTQLATAVLALI